MKKIILSACVCIVASFSLKAQVKIGDNPGTINSNSLLELESTNKGFLPPRMALNSLTTVAPLTGTVTAGMLIYSIGGSVADGYYMWNGTKWVSLATSGNVRSNYVIVKTASDFPAAAGGIRTLASGTMYEINGTITLTDKIDLNNAVITGGDATDDFLVYTPTSGELFTGANGGSIKHVTLKATGVGGKVFNINAGGAAQNMIIKNCFISNSNNVGTIRGLGGIVYLGTVAYQNNTNGIIFQDNMRVINFNSIWDSTNHNTFETYVGTFSTIQILGGDRFTLSANSATALNITGITSIAAGDLKTVMFTGTGTYVNGTFANSWEVEAEGLSTEKDEVASGNLYITATGNTNVVTMDVPLKVSGTTTAVGLFRVTMPSNNRLTYTGNKARRFQVICSVTATAASSNRYFSVHIYKNGTKLPESTQSMKFASGVSAGSLTISCTTSLAKNDYVEVWIENNSDNSDITIDNLNLSIK